MKRKIIWENIPENPSDISPFHSRSEIHEEFQLSRTFHIEFVEGQKVSIEMASWHLALFAYRCFRPTAKRMKLEIT